MTLPAGVMLPDELERRQIFYALQRWSSLTAWKRILGFFQAWADVTERSVREASVKGWQLKSRIAESDYVLILEALARLDDGVTRLGQGDKRVFKSDFNGDIAAAAQGALAHWWQAYGYMQSGDIAGGNEFTPFWEEFISALVNLVTAWRECAPHVVEDESDTLNAPDAYGDWYREWLPKMKFPDPLAAVPDPVDNLLVRTGKTVDCSGIWEPIEVPVSKIVSLFKAPPPPGPFPLVGCMNYLHADSKAPRAEQETANDSLQADVTWRLLWRDDRYADGGVPQEEAGYRFLYPERSASPQAVFTPDGGVTVLESGQQASEAGRWVLQDSLAVAIDVAQGELLPLHAGRVVWWVLT